mmetsp:Transcript_52441/g.135792  ORF Transcript_52441/g.135792 Transcript_52441/m.135792 type:complete len:330 (+) Transcript_52441:879-1868(+)
MCGVNHCEWLCGPLREFKLKHGDVAEVCSTFQHVRTVRADWFDVIMMIVSPEDDVDLCDLMSEKLVVRHAHVRQGNNDFSSLLFFQILGQSRSTMAEIFVLNVLGRNRRKCDKPLSFHQAQQTDLATVPVHESCGRTFCEWSPSLFVDNVADEPRKIALRCHVHELVDTPVEVMVTIACRVDTDRIQSWDHVFSPCCRGGQRWIESIAAEQHHGFFFTSCKRLFFELTNACNETRNSTDRLLDARLHIVHIVEMEDCHSLWGRFGSVRCYYSRHTSRVSCVNTCCYCRLERLGSCSHWPTVESASRLSTSEKQCSFTELFGVAICCAIK